MRFVQNDLQAFESTIKAAGLLSESCVHHYLVPGETEAKFIVWQEVKSENVISGDDYIEDQSIHGLLYYFTDIDFDPVFDSVQEFLQEQTDAWSWVRSEYDDQFQLIRHEWEFALL